MKNSNFANVFLWMLGIVGISMLFHFGFQVTAWILIAHYALILVAEVIEGSK